MTDVLFGVWTPTTVLIAAFAGVAAGYVVIGSIFRNPRYASGQATPLEAGRLVAGAAITIGTVFYVGQVLAAAVSGDDLWWRVMSRFTLWLLYATCLGIGAAVSVYRDHLERSRAARERVKREFGS